MAAIRGETPRAVIHKRILDAAAERPDASMAELADAVGGASVDLVERVLEEYGDPGGPAGTEVEDAASTRESDEDDADGTAGATEPAERGTEGDAPVDDASPPPAGDGLTDKQRAVLEAVYAHPDASQRELGERLGVSASTVHNRLAGVDGFEWDDRWRFVRGLFDEVTDGGATAADPEAVAELRERVASLESSVQELTDREDGLEARLQELAERGGGGDAPLTPELAHKVAHACLASDRLDESEELAVLRALMG